LIVAQKHSSAWAISARGFNTDLANKLLVLIDGRTVYTPLFSGVFWDRQDYLLEDIERIEIISGPGGTLWGANAVNGVINVITRSAWESDGGELLAQGGTLDNSASARYAAPVGQSGAIRFYGSYVDRGPLQRQDGTDATDDWHGIQGGFR